MVQEVRGEVCEGNGPKLKDSDAPLRPNDRFGRCSITNASSLLALKGNAAVIIIYHSSCEDQRKGPTRPPPGGSRGCILSVQAGKVAF